jgi:hypothetical protein
LNLGRDNGFSLLQNRPDLLMEHPQPSIPWMPGFFPAKKRPEREVDHSPSSRVAVKAEWSLTSVPPSALMPQKGEALFTLYSYFS